jgi:aspartyl-tRNA(Asn)/glutamyl-tRNA(Gln) amidotransferase subunit A
MNPSELTIVRAHEGLMKKDFSCKELIQSCLDHIKKYDREIKAFITICEKESLEKADIVDKKIKTGQKIGILEGIPFSVKDVILTEDIKTTAGSHMLHNFTAPYDATVIKKLKQAGAIIIGKVNCDAYGHGSSTENSDFFVTKNPWDFSRVSGGSSGGSAASVAANMCLFSLAEDTGGSIRQPASFCGVTGLKTSYGRVSRYGSVAYASSLDTIGPITKTAEDAAIVLQCIAGKDSYDHTTFPDDVPEYSKQINQDFSGKTIGIPKEYFPSDLNTEIKASIDASLHAFSEMGLSVKEVSLPYTKYCLSVYYLLALAETSTNLARLDGVRFGHRTKEFETLDELFQKSRSEGFGDEVQRRIMIGTYALSAGYFDAYYKQAQKVRTLIIQDFNNIFQEVDFLISPTSPFPAFPVGEKINDPLTMYLADIFTISFSLAGLPTISIPCGYTNQLPIGMQLTGKYKNDKDVLSLAYQYQKETEFHQKKPPLPF